ncbi:MAG: glycosyltransferase family 39 protein [Oscillochloris sp.]|nr:glycosyltransferase family 39 protein [Oscillochloris sp.]
MTLTPQSPLPRAGKSEQTTEATRYTSAGSAKRGWLVSTMWLLTVAMVAISLSLALLHPEPETINVGTPGDGYFLANFYPAEVNGESSYRWSGLGARLLIPAVYQRPAMITMRLQGANFAQPEDLRLSVEQPGQIPAAFKISTGWRVYQLLLPPSTSTTSFGDQTAINLVAPLTAPSSNDPRPLGFVLDSVKLRYLGLAPLIPPITRALVLTWMLGIIGWAGVKAGRNPVQLYAPGAVALLGLGAALWAWRDPGGFAWGVPSPPLWLLLASSLLLAGWDGLRRVATRWDVLKHSWLYPYTGWIAVLALGHLALLLPLPWRALAALPILGMPGWLIARLLFPEEDDLLTQGFLGLCGGLTVAPLLILALQTIPGPLPAWLLLLTANILSAVMIWLHTRRAGPQPTARSPQPSPSRRLPPAAYLLLIALALRLTLLGGAEFQGDEARAMLLAAGVAQGEDSILLKHTKGPVEALLPAGPLILAGSDSEWGARLPFTLAGFGLLIGVMVLARELFAANDKQRAPKGRWPTIIGEWPMIATVAVGLLTTDGFALGFARIVQYQSIVLLTSAGAFWACWRFYAGGTHPMRYLVSAAVLFAVGLLAHYDAGMVAPALAWLVLAGGWRRGWRWREWLGGLIVPVLVGGALLASFYIPYVTSESFGAVTKYLSWRVNQGNAAGPIFNNLPLYLKILSFYNAPQLVPIMAVALVAAICLLPFASGSARALAIWFAAPFIAESFLIADPRTHFYSAHPAAALLIGYAVAALVSVLKRGRVSLPTPLRLGAAALGVLWLSVSLSYAQLLYLRQFPEYQRAFPDARPDILRASYGERLPRAGYFGFPHSDGWKAAAELYRSGIISGSYNTNQNHWLAGWYMRDAPRCMDSPDYYLIAEGETVTRDYPAGYNLLGEVEVGPRRALAIYSRTPVTGPPQIFQIEDSAAEFNARPVESFPAAQILADTEAAACSP